MRFDHIRYIEVTGVADGSPFSGEWTADDDYIIKRIFIRRSDGGSWTKSTITIKIDEVASTKTKSSVAIWGSDVLNALVIDYDFPKDRVFKFEGVNQEGLTIDVRVELELWKK